MPFLSALDIANRALGHLGANTILSPDEDTKNNHIMADLYDKLRGVELRSSLWRFATRKAVLRPIDVSSMLVGASVWNPCTTYFHGALVSDLNGGLWISLAYSNRGQVPGGNNDAWESYFGPLVVQPWSNTTTYYAGELVYIMSSPGSYLVYQSLLQGNSSPPQVATPWNATTVYNQDQVVFSSGAAWRSLIPVNVNLLPATSPGAWSDRVTYGIGDMAIGSDNVIYTSSQDNNLDQDPVLGTGWTAQLNPAPAAWSATVGYVFGSKVLGTDSNVYTANLASTGTNPVGDLTGTWTPGLDVLIAGWTAAGTVMGNSSVNWRFMGKAGTGLTLSNLHPLYPIGSGPSSEPASRNIYRLPAGWTREAPQDPKAGNNSFLGGPAGVMLNDWDYEGNFIVTSDSSPIIYRFIADIVQVKQMDSLFCDGLAFRMAIDGCEALTQSEAKQGVVAQKYKEFMGKARLVNGIDIGPIEPPEDEWITVRQ